MDVQTASTHRARLRGLIGRRLESQHALLLPKTRSIHTFGVRGALDLVWLDAAGTVVRIDDRVPPGRVRICRKARSVLECPPGEARRFAAWL